MMGHDRKRWAWSGGILLAFTSAGGCDGKTRSATQAGGTGQASAAAGGTELGGGAGTSSAGSAAQPEGGATGVAAGGVPAGGRAASEAGQGGLDAGGAGSSPLWPVGLKNEFGFALDDSWLFMPCLDATASPTSCNNGTATCPNKNAADVEQRGYRFVERFEIGGQLGESFDITLAINGVAEGKYYDGGERRRGADFSEMEAPEGTDTWHTGGSPVASNYAIYKLTVFEPDGETEVQHYYLNSFPVISGAERHETFALSYEATITVPAQGVVEYLIVNPDCYVEDNCGSPGVGGCSAPRRVPNEPFELALPETYGGKPLASLNARNGAQQPFHAHIIHVTVKEVAVN